VAAAVTQGRARALVHAPISDEVGLRAHEAAVHVRLNLSLSASHVPDADFVEFGIGISIQPVEAAPDIVVRANYAERTRDWT